jgi:hypothetical protein
MKNSNLNRRQVLHAMTALGAAGVIGMATTEAVQAAPEQAASASGKTPPMTAGEMAAIDAAIGKKGRYVEAEAVYTHALPRNDLKVTIKGEPVPISFGFGGWVAIKKTIDGASAMLMSDTVLLQEEVNPLISAAHANGLEVSAIHNHFFYEEPRIFYMHLHGMGAPDDLAKRYTAAIKSTKLFPANQPPVAATPARTAKEIFDLPALDKITGYTGTVNGTSYKYTVGRDDLRVMAMGAEMTAAIGLNSWAAFAGDKEAAHVAGDIAMLEPEVNNVIRTLRSNNLEVVAVHNHMLGDNPRMVFLHYYGRGRSVDLARGFRAALDALGKSAMNGMRM